jgi:hypothetical protein
VVEIESRKASSMPESERVQRAWFGASSLRWVSSSI